MSKRAKLDEQTVGGEIELPADTKAILSFLFERAKQLNEAELTVAKSKQEIGTVINEALLKALKKLELNPDDWAFNPDSLTLTPKVKE